MAIGGNCKKLAVGFWASDGAATTSSALVIARSASART
jgi:hypothetical protein